MEITPTSLFSKEEVISTRLDPIFNLYNLTAISMVIMLMMQMRKNDFVLAALLICPHKSLRRRENLIARPQEGSRTLYCQSWGTRSNEIRIHVSVLSVMSSIFDFNPTCPQADRDSGSQTTAATLSVVHWEPRWTFDWLRFWYLLRSLSTCWDPQVNWQFPKLGTCPQFNPDAVRRASDGTWMILYTLCPCF